MTTIFLQLDLFLGRFHPLIVHLPIGFLLLAGLFFFLSRIERFSHLLKSLPVILFLGSLSAIAAAFIGWLLSSEGGYVANTIFWHKWLGIGVAILSILLFIWSVRKENLGFNPRNLLASSSIVLVLVLISITGHLGGNLTHGEQYLFVHAPEVIQQVMLSEKEALEFPEQPDSIRLYQHLIAPVLERKCASCHGETDQKGGLRVTPREQLLEGGEDGEVLLSGNANASTLFQRVTMDPSSLKFMPPKGDPMSYVEVKLLEYWINSGMSFDQHITDEEIPEEIKELMERNYKLITRKQSYLERSTVEPASESDLTSLRNMGFRVSTLAGGVNFLDVKIQDSLTLKKVQALVAVKEQIAWLDLSNSALVDEWMSTMAQLSNLTRLRMDKTEISNDGLSFISELSHLESLNLYGTDISDEGLSYLEDLAALRNLYLWETRVSSEGVESLKLNNPKLEVDMGVETLNADITSP